MNREKFFINALCKQSSKSFIGDDGAILDSKNLSKKFVVAADSFMEGTHFKLEWLSLEQIALKAMLVNISDMIAMGAKPKYATLCICLPKHLSFFQIKLIANALNNIAKQFDISFIGGDTISSNLLGFHITLFGLVESKPLCRVGIKRGDLILSTGRVGSSLKALKMLMCGARALDSRRFKRFVSPTLRTDFIKKAKKYINAAMDISDGVYSELTHLARQNHIGFKLYKKKDRAYTSGEEYEMLFAINKRHLRVIKLLARQSRMNLELIATASRSGKRNFKSINWH